MVFLVVTVILEMEKNKEGRLEGKRLDLKIARNQIRRSFIHDGVSFEQSASGSFVNLFAGVPVGCSLFKSNARSTASIGFSRSFSLSMPSTNEKFFLVLVIVFSWP